MYAIYIYMYIYTCVYYICILYIYTLYICIIYNIYITDDVVQGA